MVEQRVERGADLADLGALVGEPRRAPARSGRSSPEDSGSSATACAVAATSFSGRSCRRTTSVPAPAASSDAEQVEQRPRTRSGCSTVSSTSLGRQAADDRAAAGPSTARRRGSCRAPVRSTPCTVAVGGHRRRSWSSAVRGQPAGASSLRWSGRAPCTNAVGVADRRRGARARCGARSAAVGARRRRAAAVARRRPGDGRTHLLVEPVVEVAAHGQRRRPRRSARETTATSATAVTTSREVRVRGARSQPASRQARPA